MATTLSTSTLQEALQAEYPFLDTSLLAALISELPPIKSTTDEALDQLRGTLQLLSLHAEQEDADSQKQQEPEYDHISSSHLQSENILDSENGCSNPPDNLSSFTSATSTSSTPSDVSNNQISTAQGFLRVLFPRLSSSVIEQTLRDQIGNSIDYTPNEDEMHSIVDHLLNLEYIQDLMERGIERLSDTEADEDEPWQLVTSKRNHDSNFKSAKRLPKRTIPLVDIRQRQHVAHESNISKSDHVMRPKFLGDPWTRLSSLATRASDLLPSTTPGYFISYFHAPKSKLPNTKAGWKAETDALRQALTDLVARYPSKLDEAQLVSSSETLSHILLHPDSAEVETLDSEQIYRMQGDIRLCLAATSGDCDAALDLVWLLRELEEAFELGDGIAHALPLSKTTRSSEVVILGNRSAQIPPAAPPPSLHKHPPSTSSTRSKKVEHDGWTLVGPKRPNKNVHPHAAFIPAYSNKIPRANRPPDKSRDSLKNDPVRLARELYRHKQERGNLQSLRAEALREASRHWQAGNGKNYGGEVAIFYAEKARELQEEQKKWALELARLTVEEKRYKSDDQDTIDLHGLTISEAITIVRETLEEESPLSSGRSLKVITGRGRHSAGQVSVLGPAIRDMLLKEGYRVSQWDAGLIVRGKR